MKEEAHMFLLLDIIKTIQVDQFFNGEALSWGESKMVKFLKIRLAWYRGEDDDGAEPMFTLGGRLPVSPRALQGSTE